MPDKRVRVISNLDDLVQRYEAGESLKTLAAELRCDYHTLAKRFKDRGITIRHRSTYATDMTNTWAARRGNTDPIERKIQRANTRMARMLGTSKIEDDFAKLLDAKGSQYVRQFALGPYNLDFTLTETPVAVEISGGGHSTHVARRGAERLEYILDAGWHHIEIRATGQGRGRPMIGAAEYVVAYTQEVRANPTTKCENRVIRPDGQPGSSRRRYANAGT